MKAVNVFRNLRNISKNVLWYVKYLDWFLFSPFKFKKLGKVKKILVVEQIGIGDLIVATPVFRALKKRFGVKVDVLVSKGLEDVLYGNPNIGKVFSLDSFDDASALKIGIKKYDLAVLLHPDRNVGNFGISRFLKKIAKFRIGCTRVGFIEGTGWFMNRKTMPSLFLKHKVLDNLDVIKSIGVFGDDSLEIYSDKKVDLSVKRKLPKKYFVIHSKSLYENYEWNWLRFAILADKLIAKYKIPIVFTGSSSDKEYIKNIISSMKSSKVYDFSGSSLKEFFSVIKNCSLLVSVDTSAIHIGAGFDKKVVALFGAGHPKVWKPYCKNYIVLYASEGCVNCWKNKCKNTGRNYMACMNAIKVNSVLNAVRDLEPTSKK